MEAMCGSHKMPEHCVEGAIMEIDKISLYMVIVSVVVATGGQSLLTLPPTAGTATGKETGMPAKHAMANMQCSAARAFRIVDPAG